jgi:pyruvate dehydrogenase E2 component (dihydrolipoamide acetyltransferase)
MATKVVMEALSPTMEEGRLVEWKKQEGEPVTVGDVLAEVETDKAVMELVARAGGTLLKHIVEAGATVPVSEPVAVIGDPGEDGGEAESRGSGATGQRGSSADRQRAGKTQTQPARVQATQPAPDRDQPTSMPPAPPAQAATETSGVARPSPAPSTAGSPAAGSRVKASPLARRMAAERGLDLSALAGSGPEGRIIARDLASVPEASSGPAAPAPLPRRPAAPLTPYTDVPLTQIRKTIARRLAQSHVLSHQRSRHGTALGLEGSAVSRAARRR